MPRICKVCVHPKRTEIDERLAFQVVNVSALAREYGVPRKSIERHRDLHLAEFLAAFKSSADAPDIGRLNAEAQQLYLTTLDALARAQAAVLTHSDTNNFAKHETSLLTVARLIGEARKGLDLIARLAVAEPNRPKRAQEAAAPNPELDASFARALARLEERERAQ
jgi:hypothetical protein